jgi:hypothetical protein
LLGILQKKIIGRAFTGCFGTTSKRSGAKAPRFDRSYFRGLKPPAPSQRQKQEFLLSLFSPRRIGGLDPWGCAPSRYGTRLRRSSSQSQNNGKVASAVGRGRVERSGEPRASRGEGDSHGAQKSVPLRRKNVHGETVEGLAGCRLVIAFSCDSTQADSRAA